MRSIDPGAVTHQQPTHRIHTCMDRTPGTHLCLSHQDMDFPIRPHPRMGSSLHYLLYRIYLAYEAMMGHLKKQVSDKRCVCCSIDLR